MPAATATGGLAPRRQNRVTMQRVRKTLSPRRGPRKAPSRRSQAPRKRSSVSTPHHAGVVVAERVARAAFTEAEGWGACVIMASTRASTSAAAGLAANAAANSPARPSRSACVVTSTSHSAGFEKAPEPPAYGGDAGLVTSM